MSRSRLQGWLLSFVVLVIGTIGCSSDPKPDKDNTGTSGSAGVDKKPLAEFKQLKFPDDFDFFPSDGPADSKAWSTDGEIIKCSGQPRGYLYTVEEHQNFTLRFDYRFVKPENPDDVKKLNTGVLIYVSDENKIWPVSLEVQGKHIEMGQIKANGGAAKVSIDDDEEARQQARKPPGEWNSVEIVSKQGALVVTLNGTQVCSSKPGKLDQGYLGFQSEGVEVHFRKIFIQEHDEGGDE